VFSYLPDAIQTVLSKPTEWERKLRNFLHYNGIAGTAGARRWTVILVVSVEERVIKAEGFTSSNRKSIHYYVN